MADKVKCEICNRTFKDKEGYEQHKTAKHSERLENINSSAPKLDFNFKKLRNLLIIILVVGAIIWLFSITLKGSNACKTDSVTEINIGSHQNLALHTHADLEIIINGVSKEIPTNIGIGPGFMRPIHTHDNSGEIHMEGPCIRDFKLGEFFLVWGKRFDSSCILDSCIQNGAIEMMVNGKENKEFDNYIMKYQDEISIKFTSDKT